MTALLPRLADETEAALIRVNEQARAEFGPETEWTPGEMREYLLRLEAAGFDGQVVA